ncbi:hypothetical protein [Amycolatopsis thailandensis]|nr:hypothetical protein [Amycolatopsis thailandensis]
MSADLVPVIVAAAVPVSTAVITAVERIVIAWIKRRRKDGDGENEDE